MADYQIVPISRKEAGEIITWNYPPPYEVYSLSPQDLDGLLNPAYRYHLVLDREMCLAGYCCYGQDAQVPGGNYTRGEPGVLDVGVGMRPDLTGRGLGAGFVRAVLEHGQEVYQPDHFRVTIADFNQRSLRVFQKLGFQEEGRFIREKGRLPFTQLERTVYE